MARVVGEEEEMEASIWGRLPDELLERVLALLPLRSLISLRRTCRRFRSLLLTPAFLSLLPNPSSSSSSFLLLSHPQFPHHLLPLYDPSSDSWRRAHLSPSPSPSPGAAPRLLCCSSSSGLLCFSFSLNPTSSNSSGASCSLLVHNPLSNSTRLLPRAPAGDMDVAGATLVSPRLPRPHGYKLFVPAQDPARVFLYDSDADSWAQHPGFEPLLARSGAHRREGALFRGALFFATPEPPCSVVSFDLRSGAWSPPGASPAPPLPAGLAFARLVGAGAGERLFLVGGVGRDGITRSVCVWELLPLAGGGGGGWRWAEAGRLPEMMCRKLVGVCYHNYAHVYCAWHGGGAAGAGGAVCVCCATWPEVLAFRVGRATWHWFPRCPLLRDKWSCGFRWFSFAPDLYALV